MFFRKQKTRWHLRVKREQERNEYFEELFGFFKVGRLLFAWVESDSKDERLMKDFSECRKELPSVSTTQGCFHAQWKRLPANLPRLFFKGVMARQLALIFWQLYDLNQNDGGARSADVHEPVDDYFTMPVAETRKSEEAEDVRHEKESSHEEYQKAVKNPARISKPINCKGGEMRLHGCAVEFPHGAIREKTEMTISVDNNPNYFPPNLEPIALILGFKPSMEFEEPVLVTMKTWFRAREGEKIPVVLSSRKQGSDWKKVGNVTVGDTNEVQFTVTHFCQINLGIVPEQASNGEYVLSNDIFIQSETGRILSSFYLDSKSKRDIWDDLRRRSFASFAPETLEIYGRREQTVSVRTKLTAPPDTNLREGNRSRQFQILEILRRRQHNITFIPNPHFGNYDGLVEGEYIVELGGQEADKTLLVRKWPVTLDPEGPPVNITAAVYAGGRSQVTYSIKDSTVQASSNR